MPYQEQAETHRVTVKVAYVNPPRGRAKNGTIRDTDNKYFGVDPSKLNMFKVGGTYQIEYTEYEARNGQTYATVGRFKELAPPPATANGAGGGNTYRETSAVDAERMFVTAIVKAAIAAQSVALNPADLVGAINDARQAWRETFGAKTTRTGTVGAGSTGGSVGAAGKPAELDDQIPF